MKAFLVSFLMLVLTASIFPQTNAVTKFNAKESDGLFKVETTFTADSNATAFYTSPFSVPKFDLVYSTTPVLFHIKQTGTYGKPNCLYVLQGYFGSSWINIDTLRASSANQTESDTLGTMNLNSKFAPAYRVQITNAAASDINAGVMELYFPIKPRYYR